MNDFIILFETMGQTSMKDDYQNDYGWTCLKLNGRTLTIESCNTLVYSNPFIFTLYECKLSQEIPVGYPPFELFMIYFQSGFYTHIPGSNISNITNFRKACKKYTQALDDCLQGNPSIWSHSIKNTNI